MERLHFRFDGGRALPPAAPSIVGVLGSGNLEVLVEAAAENGACVIDVSTSAVGFNATWEAVLRGFFERHAAGDIRISVNDAGATPAVVSLRLDQAIEAFKARAAEAAARPGESRDA